MDIARMEVSIPGVQWSLEQMNPVFSPRIFVVFGYFSLVFSLKIDRGENQFCQSMTSCDVVIKLSNAIAL